MKGRAWPASDRLHLVLASSAIAAVTAFRFFFHLTNPTIAALSYLLIVLIMAAASSLKASIAVSVLADLCLNYFFMPPIGTFTIADPQNWVALFAFLAVAAVASNLSTTARERAREAVARRDELGRLLDLSRDVLLTTDSEQAMSQLARFVSHRFDLDFAAISPAPLWRLGNASGNARRQARSAAAVAGVRGSGAVTDARHRTLTPRPHRAAGRCCWNQGPSAARDRRAPGRACTPDALAGVAATPLNAPISRRAQGG
jgi:K+-sensing histidine kinase KdpD